MLTLFPFHGEGEGEGSSFWVGGGGGELEKQVTYLPACSFLLDLF